MKKCLVLLFLLLFVKIGYAQNWKTVPLNDTVYYTVSATGADSVWNGYLRCIWIDSVNAIGTDSVFHFHLASQRVPGQLCIDTTANTWLGKRFIRNDQGEEKYFNWLGDTILIKTFAAINDSWTMVIDSNNVEMRATITNVDTLTIDGNLDSIKTLTLHSYLNGVPTSHFLNGKILVLSKEHGMVTFLQFEYFPYLQYSHYYPSTDIHLAFQFEHKRIDKQLELLDFNKENFTVKYAAGNEWIIDYKIYYPLITIHDSIISSTPLGLDSIIVLHKIEKHKQDSIGMMVNGTWQIVRVDSNIISTQTDTFYHSNAPLFLSPKMCPDYFVRYEYLSTTSMNTIEHYLLNYVCNYPTIKYTNNTGIAVGGSSTCYDFGISVSGYSEEEWKTLSNFNFKEVYINQYNWNMNLGFHSKAHIIYLKTASCTYGNYINVLALGTNDVDGENKKILVYPNPVGDVLYFTNTKENFQYQIYDMQGEILKSGKAHKSIPIQDFPKGCYILKLINDKEIGIEKFIKE